MRQKPNLCQVGVSLVPLPQGWALGLGDQHGSQNLGRSAQQRSQHLVWGAVACVVLACNPGWLLLRHPLFYSVSSPSPFNSLVCSWGLECCWVTRFLTEAWKSPPGCVDHLPHAPLPTLSPGVLGHSEEAENRALLWEPSHFCLDTSPPPLLFLKSRGTFWSSGEAQFFWSLLALLMMAFPDIVWMPRTLFVRAFETQKPERNFFFLCFESCHRHFKNLWLGLLRGNDMEKGNLEEKKNVQLL